MDRTIRQAEQEDQETLVDCVQAAYTKYIERIAKKPAPMLADYTTLISQGVAYLLADEEGEVQGVLVMMPQDRSMFIENVTIDPRFQGLGLGRTLMAFDEQQTWQQPRSCKSDPP